MSKTTTINTLDEFKDVINETVENMSADDAIREVFKDFEWSPKYNFETMDCDTMFDVFKQHKDKATLEKMLEVIPFRDNISYMDDVLYMVSFMLNWYDVDKDYNINADTKANDFLKKAYRYTDDFIFLGVKCMKNFVNLYGDTLPISRKEEIVNKIVNQLIFTEGDEETYQKSYAILESLNKNGVEKIIDKYIFMANIDSRTLENAVPEDLL